MLIVTPKWWKPCGSVVSQTEEVLWLIALQLHLKFIIALTNKIKLNPLPRLPVVTDVYHVSNSVIGCHTIFAYGFIKKKKKNSICHPALPILHQCCFIYIQEPSDVYLIMGARRKTSLSEGVPAGLENGMYQITPDYWSNFFYWPTNQCIRKWLILMFIFIELVCVYQTSRCRIDLIYQIKWTKHLNLASFKACRLNQNPLN